MKNVLRAVTGVCLVLALGACSSSDRVATTTTLGPVVWGDYAPALQSKIDAMAVAKDCAGLQLQFNQIGGTNLAMRNRYGHGNVEVLTYIDKKEREASCF
ncbi:MAG TPA: hypothetical protein VGC84_13235 [Ilumatobacteraceae bacterium]|jgi:hypothetical protein